MNDANPVCSSKIMRRMERYVMKNCTHPAVRDVLAYVLDWNQLLLIGFFALLTVIIWQNHPFLADHASAPKLPNIISSTTNQTARTSEMLSVPVYNNPSKIMLLTGY